MPVEILIYIYLGMCAGMILFNIATALLSRRREHRSFRDGIRLELTVSRPDGEIYRDVYYFDFADETRLSAEDVLARMGLSWESLTPALIRTAVRAHDRVMQAQNGPFTSALAADALALRAQTVLAAQDARLPFYPNGDGTLTVWLNLAAGAGAGVLLTETLAERGIWVSCALLTVSFLFMFIHEKHGERQPEG